MIISAQKALQWLDKNSCHPLELRAPTAGFHWNCAHLHGNGAPAGASSARSLAGASASAPSADRTVLHRAYAGDLVGLQAATSLVWRRWGWRWRRWYGSRRCRDRSRRCRDWCGRRRRYRSRRCWDWCGARRRRCGDRGWGRRCRQRGHTKVHGVLDAAFVRTTFDLEVALLAPARSP